LYTHVFFLTVHEIATCTIIISVFQVILRFAKVFTEYSVSYNFEFLISSQNLVPNPTNSFVLLAFPNGMF
jgi:hypothetical protein